MTDCVVTGINVGSARERVNGALHWWSVDHHSPVARHSHALRSLLGSGRIPCSLVGQPSRMALT